ncbi:MAG TPA: pyridoxal phosphate-dependent aminotransferase [Limnochordia bacterium]
MRRAQRMEGLEGEKAFDTLTEVESLRAAGRSIISFAIGEPDFPTPAHVRQAGIGAIEAGETRYTPPAGITPLREAIAAHIRQTRGIPVGPENVVVMAGAKPVIFHTILACVDRGDEVLCPDPGFPAYAAAVQLAGGRAVFVPWLGADGFAFDVEALRRLAGPRTRMIVLNSPHNPTGGVLGAAELAAVAEIAERCDAWVLSDEIYSRLIYDGVHHSIASLPGMAERTIIVDGFSKAYAMTGWRIGYGVMPADLAAQVARLYTHCDSCTAAFTQRAALAALTGPQQATAAMVAELRSRRDRMVAGLNALPGVRCAMPGGAFYAFPEVSEACRRLGLADAEALQHRLLHEAGVATLTRTAFGPRRPGERGEYLRITYATGLAAIEEGLERMAKLLGRRDADPT